jgi:hypothetical protein
MEMEMSARTSRTLGSCKTDRRSPQYNFEVKGPHRIRAVAQLQNARNRVAAVRSSRKSHSVTVSLGGHDHFGTSAQFWPGFWQTPSILRNLGTFCFVQTIDESLQRFRCWTMNVSVFLNLSCVRKCTGCAIGLALMIFPLQGP